MSERTWTPWLVMPLDIAVPTGSGRTLSGSRAADDSVSGGDGPTAPQTAVHDAEALEESLEQLRRDAYEEGYAQGHARGLESGRQEGWQAGHDEGHETGYAAGYEKGRDQAAREAQRLADLTSQSALALERMEHELGQDLLKLAVRIAEYVVQATLTDRPDIVVELVRRVLATDPAAAAPLQVHLHPDDLELVQDHLSQHAHTPPCHLIADASLQRGDCIARSAFADADARLETRWQNVIASLTADTS